MRLEVESGGFDGLGFVDAFVSQIETAVKSTARLRDAQRALGDVVKNQMDDLRRYSQAVRDLADPWGHADRATER